MVRPHHIQRTEHHRHPQCAAWMRRQAWLPGIMCVSEPMTLRTAVPACSSSPIPAVAQRLAPLAGLAPDQCRSLIDSLAQLAYPRHRRGRRQRPRPQITSPFARRDGPHYRCGPRPSRRAGHHQRDRPVPAALDHLDLADIVSPPSRSTPTRARRLAGHPKHAAYLLIIKGNQPALRHQLTTLPWPDIPVADRTRGCGHGRVKLRRLQVTTVAGLDFPTPPRRSASPAGPGPCAAGAGTP